MSKNSSSRLRNVMNLQIRHNRCEWCKKPEKSVTTRSTRTGTCNYCEKCYNTQVLFS